MDQAAELDELRRLAYSRSGTEDDRRRLAQLELSAQTTTASPPPPTNSADEAVEAGDDGTPREESVVEGTPVVRFRWLPAVVGAIVGAALATACTLAVVANSTSRPESDPGVASALAVFDREPLAVDDPSNLSFPIEYMVSASDGSTPLDVDDVTLRWVGMVAGNDVYAARWPERDDATICLIVVSDDGGGAGCTPESDFIANGLRLSTFGVDVKWGPSGTEVWVSSFR